MNSYNDIFFNLSIRIGKDLYSYESEPFRFSELDIINIIKICLIQKRAISLGKKFLAIYKDSTENRKEMTNERLKLIGIQNAEEPIIEKTAKKK